LIKDRITPIIEKIIPENQTGFRKGKGTREAILQLRTICERNMDMKKDTYICFIDFQKAFDKVRHNKLREVMKLAGIPDLERKLIEHLYWNEEACVRTKSGETKYFKIRRGVRQGCILSPILFNLYSEYLVSEALNGLPGIKIGGYVINNIRYADDTTLLAENENDLKTMVMNVVKIGTEYGMELNLKKTKVMVVSKEFQTKCNIIIDNVPLQQVEGYKYLGSYITDDGRNEKEIRMRTGTAEEAFWKMKELMRRDLNIEVKKKLIQCYIFPLLTYGCETWTMNRKIMKKITAFELWCYRRILRISWMDKITNNVVLERSKATATWSWEITRRKMSYAGHIMRGSAGDLPLILIEGRIEGTKRRGDREEPGWTTSLIGQTKRIMEP
jgi:hypothetical protein